VQIELLWGEVHEFSLVASNVHCLVLCDYPFSCGENADHVIGKTIIPGEYQNSSFCLHVNKALSTQLNY
jgi:hypothetical protein